MFTRLYDVEKDEPPILPDPQIVLTYDTAHLENDVLAL